MIKKSTKLWMDIYNKTTDSKQFVPFTSKHPQHCLTNIPLPLVRGICIIVESEKRIAKTKIPYVANRR